MGNDAPAIDRTFVIADVRGYTRFTREHGDAAAARLASVFADLARDAVEARGGEVLELRGDEALCVFIDPAQAVRAAIEFQSLCAEEYAADPTLPLNVGIGVDAGEAIPVQGGYRGKALNMAARLCSNAGAGQVLVSDTIADRIADTPDLRLEDRGEATLKGFDGAVRLIEATDAAPLEHRTDAPDPAGTAAPPPALDASTPLVGREHEMRWLRGTWRQARRGRGRIVALSGPSQIGKTRLAAELADLVARRGDVVRYAGLGGTAAAEAQAVIADTRSATAPTLLVLDDLDAMGPAALAALDDASAALARSKVLVVCTVRDDSTTPALAAFLERIDVRGDGERLVPPLDDDEVRGIVEQYVDLERTEIPLESFVRSSGGTPGRVHEVVGSWAREETSRRLEAAAEWMAAGRSQRAADLAFANDVIGRGLHRLYTAEDADLDTTACPYMGLASFADDDAGLFFGREALVGELAARTVQTGLLGVVGASGAGKSSVIAAGLIPSLAAGLLPGSERWQATAIRPGEHPMAELARAPAPTDQRTILVIDQFEEVFTICADERERAEFIDAIAEQAAQPERTLVVIGLRGDHYGSCAPYPALATLLAANNVLVGPMTREELRRAIELPARRVGWRVEAALIEALIDETGEEAGGLPLLSTALVELWQRSSDGWLRFATYEETGGVRGAVARLAERSYGTLTEPQREVARAVFLRLVADEDELVSRRRVPLEEFDADRDAVTASVLARLTEDRLLTRNEDSVEVAHEALLREWPRLRAWLDDDAEGRRLRGHLTRASKQWDAADRADEELYRGARLSAALDWSTGHGVELNELERVFLQASRAAGEREAMRQRRTNRRLKTLLAGVAAFLVLALVAGVVALGQRSNAQRKAEEAQRQTTAADAQRIGALAIVEKRPDLALLLAAEGYRLDALPETRGALMQTLMKYPHLLGVSLPTGERILRVESPPGGQVFAVADNFGALVLYDGVSLQPLYDAITLPFIDEMVFAPDGETVFVAGWTTKAADHGMSLRAVDVATGVVRWERRIPSSDADANEAEGVPGAYRLGITPDGRDVTWQVPDVIHRYDVHDGTERRPLIQTRPDAHAFILGGDRLLQVWWRHVQISDLATGRTIHRWTKTFPMDSATVVSPDQQMLATAGWDGTASGIVATIDLRTGEIREMHGQQQNWIPDLAFNPDGSLLASIDDTGDVAVWDTALGLRLQALVGHSALLRGVAWADEGRTLVTAGLDNQMMTWDLAGDRSFVRQAPRPGPQCADHCAFAHFGFTPDGRIVTLDAPVDGGWRVRYLDPQTFRQVGALPRAAIDCCMAPAISPDGTQIATIAPLAGTVTLRDASTGARIRRLFDTDAESVSRFPSAYATATVAFSPDGSTVATNENADVLLIDPQTARVVARLPTKDYVEFISFSPDGRLLEGASDDGRITVWDTATHEQIWQKKIDTDVALGGQFSPDGSLLIAGSITGRIHMLDAATGEERTDLRILAHASLVGSLNFSPDGSIFATTGVDGLTYLWDGATGRSLGEPFYVGGSAMNAFSQDGSTLYVSTFETIYAFDVAPSALIARACAIAGRTLTVDEWSRYLPDRSYEDPCLD